jgi:hypothetical protein
MEKCDQERGIKESGGGDDFKYDIFATMYSHSAQQ